MSCAYRNLCPRGCATREWGESPGRTFASRTSFERSWSTLRATLAALALAVAVPTAALGTDGAAVQPISFNRDIRPILADTCWHCHGPGRQEGGVRFDMRQSATVESESGIVPIVPGDPDSSEAIRRIFSDDSSEQMPPPGSNKVLTSDQKETIRCWIAEGAEYESHWAYRPLRRPVVPGTSGHPIDCFVEAGLHRASLDFNVEAERALLLRRLSFDLTGLPPSPGEIGAFVSGAENYDEAVDRLLASPRFAERQAQFWLDAVRFADTRGFHSDEEFPIWPYRDYVLHAFDDNLPFDVFTREQLAGDLLPGATAQQKVASAFNRLNRTSVESGIQEKEYLAKYGADRVRTLGTVWLGQTVGCAECHDHKYDPIKQSDFYALKAFFAELKYPGATGGQLDLPSEVQSNQLTVLTKAIARVETELTALAETLRSQRLTCERQLLDDSADGHLEWVFPLPISAQATNGVQLKVYDSEPIDSEFVYDSSQYVRRWVGNGIVEAAGANPDTSTYEVRIKPGEGRWSQLGLEVFADARLSGNIRARSTLR